MDCRIRSTPVTNGAKRAIGCGNGCTVQTRYLQGTSPAASRGSISVADPIDSRSERSSAIGVRSQFEATDNARPLNSSASSDQLRTVKGTTAAVSGFLAAAGACTYDFLASQPALPPLDDTLTGLGAGAAVVAVGSLAGAATMKAALRDKFHLEFHRGRLYVTLNVPSQGPPLQPGAVGVRPTGNPSLGNGAYAALPIPEGTHIADYSGDLLGRREFFERYPDGVGDYAMAIDDEWVLDAVNEVQDTPSFHPVHMNHSSSRANVRRFYDRKAGRVAFFAITDIQPGQELLYDYGRDYWRGREHLELP